jgi:hypothetical protein
MPNRLTAKLLRACADAQPHLVSPPARAAVAAVVDRLSDPTLRIAVGGRINAGKSTLVNALLGRRLAPTRSTECTKLAAWFRDAATDRLEVHLRDGRTLPAATRPDGGVPDTLDYDHTEVTHLTVHATGLRLGTECVLVDTPGNDALSGLDDYSMEAIRQADALIYVTQDATAIDKNTLDAFRGEMIGARLSALNVLGVLSQVDRIQDEDPPAERRRKAGRIARGAAKDLGGLVLTVVPVTGLLAEATACDLITRADADALVTLARSGPTVRRALRLSDTWFLDKLPDDAPVDRAIRQGLLHRLGRYGIEEAITAIDAGITDPTGIGNALTAASGIEDLIDLLRRHFMAAADPIRVDAAAYALTHDLAEAGLPWQADDPNELAALTALLDTVTWLRREPAMQRVALADVARVHAEKQLHLDEDAVADLRRVMTEQTIAGQLGCPADADRAALAAAAAALVGRWKDIEYDTPRRARHHVTLVRDMWEHLYFAASSQDRG